MWGHDTGNYSKGQQCRVMTQGITRSAMGVMTQVITREVSNVGSCDRGNYSRGQQCGVTTQGITHEVSNVGSRLRALLTRSAM